MTPDSMVVLSTAPRMRSECRAFHFLHRQPQRKQVLLGKQRIERLTGEPHSHDHVTGPSKHPATVHLDMGPEACQISGDRPCCCVLFLDRLSLLVETVVD